MRFAILANPFPAMEEEFFMSLINISHLTFSYEGSYENIFNDVSFQIDTDWKLGFCGRNGRGKTTFLNLLMKKHEYNGKISTNTTFEYFPFPINYFSIDGTAKTTLDILSEIEPNALIWQMQKDLSLLDLDEKILSRHFSTLSNGEQTKVLLAGLFLRENSFLLIDEPTNHLDMNARQIVAKYLKSKSGFILVSHDRTFLDECTDHTLSINKNNIEVINGNFSTWQEQKKRRDSFEQAQNERLAREVDRLKESSARTANWSDKVEKSKNQQLKSGLSADKGYIGHKAAKMMKRSKTIEKRKQDVINEKSTLIKNIEVAETLKIHPLDYHSSRLLSLENAAISYDGRKIFHNINLMLEQGDRMAILGGNGSGKSSILKLLCGNDIPYQGNVHIGSNLIISYVPQDASFLSGNLNEYADEQQIDETLFKTILRKLDFSRMQFEKNMQNYSAGQKKKVLLAASLCKRAHVYIWDEPLNYIDILSRMQIEELILSFKPTLIFVEHDKKFCDNIATKTINLKNQNDLHSIF